MLSVMLETWNFLEEYSGAITVVIALIAAVWALVQMRQTNNIRKHEFEDIYVQRYWEIMDRLTADQKVALMRGGDGARNLADDKDAREVLWQYLELCEDEADLRASNLITKSTWKIWHGGISQAANRPPYSTILEALISEFDAVSQEELPFQQLRAAKGKEFYDPRAWRNRRKSLGFNRNRSAAPALVSGSEEANG